MNGCNESQKPLLLTLNSKLYDVAPFAKKHPGGEKVLRKLAGGEIDQFMTGENGLLGVRHEHSKAAYDILERYAVDRSFEKDALVDAKKPIVWKVGTLGERYWTWIHQPYEGSLRLFESDFVERLTNTAWWVIPLVWLPPVIIFASMGLGHMCRAFGLLNGTLAASFLFAVGTLAWTLLEYTLHKNVFHWKPNTKSYNQITLHFLIHGLHHKSPMDPNRLVFPPTAALPIVAFFYLAYVSILPWPVFCCFASGKLFGYICYDCSHYYLHHGNPEPSTSMHFRKVYHHNHHFKDADLAYGISTVLWDHVFGTVGQGPLLT